MPSYSPDFNGGARWAQAIWVGIREEVTANTRFGTAAKVRAKVDASSRGVADRVDEVKRRCRTALQASAEALVAPSNARHAGPVAASL